MIVPTDIDFGEYLAFLGEQESQEIRPAKDFDQALYDLLENGDTISGDKLPWGKTQNCIRMRPGELSIWAGINGHRKSMLLGMVMMWLAKEQRICIASLEMKPEKTLQRMFQQATGCKPAVTFAEGLMADYGEQIYIYDQLDTVEATKILGMVHYAATELQCSHIVVDSLTKCGLGTDDYTAQKTFVDRLAWAAKRHNVHVHLVCHMRKGSDEARKPGKFDIRGASEITDLADNVYVTWKDKRREEIGQKIDRGLSMDQDEQDYYEKTCDQYLIVEKQRDGEWEGSFRLWFHAPSLQFIGDDSQTAMPFNFV